MRIKIISNTAASGVVFSRGAILTTPDDLSESDARTLILHRRAVNITEEKIEKLAEELIKTATEKGLDIHTVTEEYRRAKEQKPKRRIKK